MREAASCVSSTGGDIGKGATEEAGDLFERLTDAEDMKVEWGVLKLLSTGSLLSLCWDFSGGTPELVVAHVLAWQAPKCCHSLGILSTSGGIGAVDVAHDVGGCGQTPLCTLPFLQLDQGVAESSLVCIQVFPYTMLEVMHETQDESSKTGVRLIDRPWEIPPK